MSDLRAKALAGPLSWLLAGHFSDPEVDHRVGAVEVCGTSGAVHPVAAGAHLQSPVTRGAFLGVSRIVDCLVVAPCPVFVRKEIGEKPHGEFAGVVGDVEVRTREVQGRGRDLTGMGLESQDDFEGTQARVEMSVPGKLRHSGGRIVNLREAALKAHADGQDWNYFYQR